MRWFLVVYAWYYSCWNIVSRIITHIAVHLDISVSDEYCFIDNRLETAVVNVMVLLSAWPSNVSSISQYWTNSEFWIGIWAMVRNTLQIPTESKGSLRGYDAFYVRLSVRFVMFVDFRSFQNRVCMYMYARLRSNDIILTPLRVDVSGQ